MSYDYTKAEILDLIEKTARTHGIPPEDFLRFAYIETGGGFDEAVNRGSKGAKGLFQFVPETAEQYGLAGRELDAVANAEAAARFYLDNRGTIVRSHEMSGRPFLSGREIPDGLDMYLAHQQGADGYRSIQAAIATGYFARRDTRGHLFNNISATDFEKVSGKDYEALIRMPDRELALAFVDYWGAKFDRIRIPEKGIEPVEESRRVRDQPAAYVESGIALRSAYDMTTVHDQVRYGFGSKNLERGRIDCSGWVVQLINASYDEINEKSGRKVFPQADHYSACNDAAASIVRKAVQHSGLLIEGKDVAQGALREGMVIGEDNGAKGWDKGRYKGIDHIVMVLRDPDSGELMVSQSRGGEGVEMLPLDDYLAYKHRRGVKLYASDPLSEARSLLASENEAPAPKVEGEAIRRANHTLDAISHELEHMRMAPDVAEQQRPEPERPKPEREVRGLHEAYELARRPTLCDPDHPDYLLYAQVYDRLKQFGRTLDFGAEAQYVNAAACLAVQAKASGLKQVDHVVQGKEGRNLIAVQGRIDDPGNLWVHVDKALAAAQPIQLSTMQIDFLRQKQPPERARETADMGMAIGR